MEIEVRLANTLLACFGTTRQKVFLRKYQFCIFVKGVALLLLVIVCPPNYVDY